MELLSASPQDKDHHSNAFGNTRCQYLFYEFLSFIIRHSNNDTYFVNLNIGTYFCYLYNNFQSIMADHFWIRIHSVNLNIGTYFCYLTHTKTSSSQIWSQMTTAQYLPLFPLLFLIAVSYLPPILSEKKYKMPLI